MNKTNWIIGSLILIALISFLQKDWIINVVQNKIIGNQNYKNETLVIGLNSPATDLGPQAINLNNTIRTANIYEGLVSFDSHLKISPSLAVSWGNIDESTWEFKLRKGVIFHDGSSFNAQDIINCYENIKNTPDSQVINYLKAIKSIEKIDDYRIKIITHDPDPLLLSKLTKFSIHKPEYIGTGSYKIREWVKGKTLSLTVFSDYWGRQPVYRNVEYRVIPSKTQRNQMFDDGEINILVAVPREQTSSLPREQLKSSYGLEVSFIMFNLDHSILKDIDIRKAFRLMFNPKKIEEIGNYFVRQTAQFVAPGVYGYNNLIKPIEYKEESRPKNLFGKKLETISIDYLAPYQTLVDYLKKQMSEAGFLVYTNPLSADKLLEKIRNNESDIYILGWQAEDGDAEGFLNTFIHSGGEFNNGRYTNKEIDQLIDESQKEMDPKKRLQLLKSIMPLIHNDVIGIPLFESSRVYAIQEDIEWEPRLDGLVMAKEVE